MLYAELTVQQARGGDTWAGSYPRDLARLAGLVAAVPQRVVFLSGDIHYGEVSHRNNFYDITSSGITHVQKVDPGDNNAFRINGTLVREPNAGELDVWAHEARLLGANGSVLAEVALADYWSVVL